MCTGTYLKVMCLKWVRRNEKRNGGGVCEREFLQENGICSCNVPLAFLLASVLNPVPGVTH